MVRYIVHDPIHLGLSADCSRGRHDELPTTELCKLIRCQHIIHVKGFASGIDFSLPHNRVQKRKLIDQLRTEIESFYSSSSSSIAAAAAYNVAIVWDGDNFARGSYTSILCDIATTFEAFSLQFWAVVSDRGSIRRFQQAWDNQLSISEIHVVPASNINHGDYANHGIQALVSSGSQSVYSLGGGEVVEAEYQVALKRGIQFNMFDFARSTNRGHGANGEGEYELERFSLFANQKMF
jgi:hypothetical protein